MKASYKLTWIHTTIITLCSIVALPSLTRAINCNSSSNGSWAAAGTWTCGFVPVNGDVVAIAANTTVTISSNISYTGAPMHVKVYGTWRFNGGGAKISMPCGSSVLIGFGGQVIGNGSGSSQTIKICTTTYWSASSGTVPGPAAWPVYVLPVELISFTGKADGKRVDLKWVTASEQGSENFVLNRSRDGVEWETAATISAAGSSTITNHYSYADEVPATGIWYYKLIQIDTDGSTHDKGIIAVQVEADDEPLTCSLSQNEGWIEAHWPGSRVRSAVITDLRGIQQVSMLTWIDDDRSRADISRLKQKIYVLTAVSAAGDRRSCKFMLP